MTDDLGKKLAERSRDAAEKLAAYEKARYVARQDLAQWRPHLPGAACPSDCLPADHGGPPSGGVDLHWNENPRLAADPASAAASSTGRSSRRRDLRAVLRGVVLVEVFLVIVAGVGVA